MGVQPRPTTAVVQRRTASDKTHEYGDICPPPGICPRDLTIALISGSSQMSAIVVAGGCLGADVYGGQMSGHAMFRANSRPVCHTAEQWRWPEPIHQCRSSYNGAVALFADKRQELTSNSSIPGTCHDPRVAVKSMGHRWSSRLWSFQCR